MTTLLIIDDDPSIAQALGINFRARGYEVHLAHNAAAGLQLAARFRPHAVLLDLGLPDMDGADVVRGIRGWSNTPIIVLSARNLGSEKVALLDLGADDYITKPFDMDELVARVRAALRRGRLINSEAEQSIIHTDTFDIDLQRGIVTKAQTPVRLTPTEWHILEILARNANKLVPQQQLLLDVWGKGYEDQTNYLRVYLAALRRKLEVDPSRPRHLVTEPGIGYRLLTE